MQGKEWIEREKQRRHPHLDLFGDERRKCEKERMDAERLFHTFRLQPKKQPSAKKMPKQGIKVPVFDKRKAYLDEKRSCFNRFRTSSRTVPVFIVQLTHKKLSFFTMMVMTDE